MAQYFSFFSKLYHLTIAEYLSSTKVSNDVSIDDIQPKIKIDFSPNISNP